MPYLNQALVFLIELAFSLYTLAIVLRFLLQAARADFYNPFSQVLVKITDPVLQPLRRVIPSTGRFDNASLAMMLMLMLTRLYLVAWVSGYSPGLAGVLITAIH